MRRMQVCVGLVLMMAMLFSSVSRADHWLVAVLSGNARADAWLIPLDKGDDHKPLLHNIADSKTNPAFVGHFGNIAYGHFAVARDHAIYLTGELLSQMLPEIMSLHESEKLGEEPRFSFLYAMAGLDAVDGLVPGYSAALGRTTLHEYESMVDEQFRSNGITLDTLVGVHDGSLLLNAVQTAGSVTSNLVIFDDTYGIGYRLDNGQVVDQRSVNTDRIPSGGYFQMGFQGGKILGKGNTVSEHLNLRLREFWGARGLHYSPDEIRMRYISNNRNELGGVMTRMINDAATLGAESVDGELHNSLRKTVDALVELSQSIHPEPSSVPVVVKIIGFYGDELDGQPILKERFNALTGGSIVPELISGHLLNQSLTTAAAHVFRQVMHTRYGAQSL